MAILQESDFIHTSSSSSVQLFIYLFIYFLSLLRLCDTDFSDRDNFYRQVGRLPLVSGKSLLSEAVCPDVIQKYRDLLVEQRKGVLEHDDMLRHPQTVQLDSMFQLVLNCRQRSQFVTDIRMRGNRNSEDVTEVPSPGVPFNYLGIPVTDDTSQHKDTEDIVDEYDWLRKLVLDGSS